MIEQSGALPVCYSVLLFRDATYVLYAEWMRVRKDARAKQVYRTMTRAFRLQHMNKLDVCTPTYTLDHPRIPVPSKAYPSP
jgi:hypothetical protein